MSNKTIVTQPLKLFLTRNVSFSANQLPGHGPTKDGKSDDGGDHDKEGDIKKDSLASLNPLAALIAPLAALILLGAASALSGNPLLLQLAVVNGNNGRKRRKR